MRAQAAEETQCSQAFEQARFHIIRNARMENVGKSQSCMISKLRIIWKQAERVADGGLALWGHPNENYNGVWFWKPNQVLHGWPFYQVYYFLLETMHYARFF